MSRDSGLRAQLYESRLKRIGVPFDSYLTAQRVRPFALRGVSGQDGSLMLGTLCTTFFLTRIAIARLHRRRIPV